MFVYAIIGGFLGSIVMLAILYLITLSKITNADMVRALGSLVTKKMENSIQIGLLIYFTGGIIFAFLYFVIFSYFPLQEPGALLFLGAFGGFAHGLFVSFSLIISIAGRHPIKCFRNAGFGVAIAHIIGHVAYGLTLAVSYIAFYQPIRPPDAANIGPDAIYAMVILIFGVALTIGAAIYSGWKQRKRPPNANHEEGRPRAQQL